MRKSESYAALVIAAALFLGMVIRQPRIICSFANRY